MTTTTRLTEHSTKHNTALNGSAYPLPLQKPSRISGRSGRFDQLKIEFGGSLLQQIHLLLTVSLLVVLQAFVDVLVSPGEHAIDQAGELVGHGGDRLGGPEFAAEAAVLGAEVTLAPQQRGGSEP